MSSATENKEKEVTPEALLERLRNAKTIGDVYNIFFYDLQPLMMDAILKAKADINTKAEALYYYGMLADAFDILLVVFTFAKHLSLYHQQSFYEDIMKAMRGVITVYGDLKKGKSLEEAKGTFDYLAWKIRRDIREFTDSLEKSIRDLGPI